MLAHQRQVAQVCLLAQVAVVADRRRQPTVLRVALAASPVAAVAVADQRALAFWVAQVARVAQDMWRFTHGKRLCGY